METYSVGLNRSHRSCESLYAKIGFNLVFKVFRIFKYPHNYNLYIKLRLLTVAA